MLLYNFTLNTDYDTLKERDVIRIVISTEATTLHTGSNNFNAASDGVGSSSFEIVGVTSTFFPTIGLTGDDSIYDDGEVEYAFFVSKTSSLQYRFRLRAFNYSGHDVNIPAGSWTANIHQFVPSSQDS